MTPTTKPMTRAVLQEYAATYKPFFTGWTAVRGNCYARASGPIAQQVWFENLRSGAYRPVTAVSILVAEGGALLHQFLDIRNREVLPAAHVAMFEQVCSAMCEQFVPPIHLPLDASAICRICEDRAVESINDAHSLAALNAFLGDSAAAEKWIAVLLRLTIDRDDLETWEKDRQDAAIALQRAIATGTVQAYLDGIRLSETARILGESAAI